MPWSNGRTPEIRSTLLKLTPPSVDLTIITASSWVWYLNRRQETYTEPSVGLTAICAFCTSRDPVLNALGALQVAPQLVDRENRITDCSLAPCPVNAEYATYTLPAGMVCDVGRAVRLPAGDRAGRG